MTKPLKRAGRGDPRLRDREIKDSGIALPKRDDVEIPNPPFIIVPKYVEEKDPKRIDRSVVARGKKDQGVASIKQEAFKIARSVTMAYRIIPAPFKNTSIKMWYAEFQELTLRLSSSENITEVKKISDQIEIKRDNIINYSWQVIQKTVLESDEFSGLRKYPEKFIASILDPKSSPPDETAILIQNLPDEKKLNILVAIDIATGNMEKDQFSEVQLTRIVSDLYEVTFSASFLNHAKLEDAGITKRHIYVGGVRLREIGRVSLTEQKYPAPVALASVPEREIADQQSGLYGEAVGKIISPFLNSPSIDSSLEEADEAVDKTERSWFEKAFVPYVDINRKVKSEPSELGKALSEKKEELKTDIIKLNKKLTELNLIIDIISGAAKNGIDPVPIIKTLEEMYEIDLDEIARYGMIRPDYDPYRARIRIDPEKLKDDPISLVGKLSDIASQFSADQIEFQNELLAFEAVNWELEINRRAQDWIERRRKEVGEFALIFHDDEVNQWKLRQVKKIPEWGRELIRRAERHWESKEIEGARFFGAILSIPEEKWHRPESFPSLTELPDKLRKAEGAWEYNQLREKVRRIQSSAYSNNAYILMTMHLIWLFGDPAMQDIVCPMSDAECRVEAGIKMRDTWREGYAVWLKEMAESDLPLLPGKFYPMSNAWSEILLSDEEMKFPTNPVELPGFLLRFDQNLGAVAKALKADTEQNKLTLLMLGLTGVGAGLYLMGVAKSAFWGGLASYGIEPATVFAICGKWLGLGILFTDLAVETTAFVQGLLTTMSVYQGIPSFEDYSKYWAASFITFGGIRIIHRFLSWAFGYQPLAGAGIISRFVEGELAELPVAGRSFRSVQAYLGSLNGWQSSVYGVVNFASLGFYLMNVDVPLSYMKLSAPVSDDGNGTIKMIHHFGFLLAIIIGGRALPFVTPSFFRRSYAEKMLDPANPKGIHIEGNINAVNGRLRELSTRWAAKSRVEPEFVEPRHNLQELRDFAIDMQRILELKQGLMEMRRSGRGIRTGKEIERMAEILEPDYRGKLSPKEEKLIEEASEMTKINEELARIDMLTEAIIAIESIAEMGTLGKDGIIRIDIGAADGLPYKLQLFKQMFGEWIEPGTAVGKKHYIASDRAETLEGKQYVFVGFKVRNSDDNFLHKFLNLHETAGTTGKK